MAVLGGADMHTLIGQAASSEHAYAIRRLHRSVGDNPAYLCDEPARRVFEIVYLKLSVFLRILTVMRESHKLLSEPLGIANTTITATVVQSTAIVPTLWNYRLMTAPSTVERNEGSNTFSDDAYHFGLMMAVSLLANTHNDSNLIREKIIEITKFIDQTRMNDSSTSRDSAISHILDIHCQSEVLHFRNVFYQSIVDIHSLHIHVWRKLLTFIFRLTSCCSGFSYYHAPTANSASIIDDIFNDDKLLQAEL